MKKKDYIIININDDKILHIKKEIISISKYIKKILENEDLNLISLNGYKFTYINNIILYCIHHYKKKNINYINPLRKKYYLSKWDHNYIKNILLSKSTKGQEVSILLNYIKISKKLEIDPLSELLYLYISNYYSDKNKSDLKKIFAIE